MLLAFGFGGCGSSGTSRLPVNPGARQATLAKAAPRAARPLRVPFDRNGEVTRVLRLSDDPTEPGTFADYALEPATRDSCKVGPSELDCLTKIHGAKLGDREAALAVREHAPLPGRLLSSEITAADGNVIYRASLNEHGNGRPTGNATAGLATPASGRAR